MSNALSSLFGGKPRAPTAVATAKPVEQKGADIARDELLKRLAKLRRATQVSQLTEPNVKRTTLGAGAR